MDGDELRRGSAASMGAGSEWRVGFAEVTRERLAGLEHQGRELAARRFSRAAPLR